MDYSNFVSDEQVHEALNYINVNSFLSFMDLTRNDTHLSQVYHAMCTQIPFSLISAWHRFRPDGQLVTQSENEWNTGRLLVDIRSNGFSAILLLAHFEDCDQPEQLFFITRILHKKDIKEWLIMLVLFHSDFDRLNGGIWTSQSNSGS